VDSEKDAQEAAQWKNKYFESLEEFERKEKQWRDADELLRKTVSRLTLAADGLDDTLDRQLRELRNAIRDRAGSAQLRSRIDDMSRTLVKLDTKRKQHKQQADDTPLLDLLDALSLPRGTGRQTKSLRKQLQSGSKADGSAAIQSFAELIALAIELSAGEEPASGETDAGGGLFGRLFGAQPKQAAAEQASVAETSETPAASPPPAAEEAVDRVREILIQLLERLSLPQDLLARVGTIRDQIEKITEGESWDRILEQIADLVQAIRAQTQKEKQGIEDFLKQLTERLQEVDRQLQDSEQYYDDTLEAGQQLDTAVKKEISGIENSVRRATELDQLKQDVQIHIDSLMAHMDKHREVEQRRYDDAKREIVAMNDRLHDMEQESEELRSQVTKEHNQAMTDALTGIPNRLAYEERLQQEVARWKRFGNPLVLVMWDIDHFKNINDSFGHKAGDKVLRTIANVLADKIRETDFVARYGGEEFVMLMTGSSLADSFPVAEKLRTAIESTGFHFRDQAITITASCGLAEFRDGDSTEQCFERADKALYKAKKEGRNRCELAE
jgi:diguanylate cyclase